MLDYTFGYCGGFILDGNFIFAAKVRIIEVHTQLQIVYYIHTTTSTIVQSSSKLTHRCTVPTCVLRFYSDEFVKGCVLYGCSVNHTHVSYSFLEHCTALYECMNHISKDGIGFSTFEFTFSFPIHCRCLCHSLPAH